MPRRYLNFLLYSAFVPLYVFLGWIAFTDSPYGFNIASWNPALALGLCYWITFGKRIAGLWLAAIFLTHILNHWLVEDWRITLASSAILVGIYWTLGELLRRNFSIESFFSSRKKFQDWLLIIAVGTLIKALIYVSFLLYSGAIRQADYAFYVVHYWVKDIVGALSLMPFILILVSPYLRPRLLKIIRQWETTAYIGILLALTFVVFNYFGVYKVNHFYLLFLPIIWAAIRHGIIGAALITFVFQCALIIATKWLDIPQIPIFELQLLTVVVGFLCFLIGVAVDEQKRLAQDLDQASKMTVAGEMAAALTHELNQPMTALSAYGKACLELLEKRGDEKILTTTIHRMIDESVRASNVVKRLRDFFRTGSMHFERIEVKSLLASVEKLFSEQFERERIIFNKNVAPDVWLVCDPFQIELVLRNLLDNAADSVLNQPAGNRIITLSAAVLSKGRLSIVIEDSGEGAPAEIASKLFEPFVSSKSTGMGLGLALSRSIISAHGGEISADVRDHGIFHIDLPLAEEKENDAG